MDVEEVVQQKEHGDAEKYYQRHFHARLFIDFGNQVGSRDINRDSGGQREARGDIVAKDCHSKNAGDGCRA